MVGLCSQIELVDMHFGTGPDGAVVDYDPLALKDHLREIEMCSKVSKSIFFIVSFKNSNICQTIIYFIENSLLF